MKEERKVLEAGQKLLGLITNLRHETDYLPDFYYEWMDRLISETDEILTDDPCKLPEGQTDKPEPFQSFPKDDIQFRVITPSSYDGTINGLLNADEEHTGEEVQNSRGFYKRMTLEEAKELYHVSEEEIKLFMEGRKDQEQITCMQFLKSIERHHPEVLKEFITEHYGK